MAVYGDRLENALKLPERRLGVPELVVVLVILPDEQVVVASGDELVVAIIEELDGQREVVVGWAAAYSATTLHVPQYLHA